MWVSHVHHVEITCTPKWYHLYAVYMANIYSSYCCLWMKWHWKWTQITCHYIYIIHVSFVSLHHVGVTCRPTLWVYIMHIISSELSRRVIPKSSLNEMSLKLDQSDIASYVDHMGVTCTPLVHSVGITCIYNMYRQTVKEVFWIVLEQWVIKTGP